MGCQALKVSCQLCGVSTPLPANCHPILRVFRLLEGAYPHEGAVAPLGLEQVGSLLSSPALPTSACLVRGTTGDSQGNGYLIFKKKPRHFELPEAKQR